MGDKPKTESEMASKSQWQGGSSTVGDVHRGARTGFHGALWRAVWGDDPADFDKAIEYEMRHRQEVRPDRFVLKIDHRSTGKTKKK